MELQDFITQNTNYIQLFQNDKTLKIKKFQKDLILLKLKYNISKDISIPENEYWKMYCRGAVINTKLNKVVCLPPIKSIELELNDNYLNYLKMGNLQELIDGTMINLFHYNNEWIISTRSEIGGYNKWNNKSFKTMFNECFDYNYDNLNTKFCYSFVMRHTENRNISKIIENSICLVEVYDLENMKKIHTNDYPKDIIKVHNLDYINVVKQIENFDMNGNFNNKGFTIKVNNKRYKIINPHFEFVKSLKINYANDLLSYIELRKNGNLKYFLKYFPEKIDLFDDYREKIHILSNDIYSNYKSLFVFKNKDKKDVPYHLKPFVYEIHSEYLKTKKPTNWGYIKSYVHNLPSKRLVFSINYME